jgi:CheY-like chemotaxis protein
MDGLAFVRELRKADVRLPVLLVSGYAEAIRSEAEKVGILLLAKPYRVDELGRVLANVLTPNDAASSGARLS